MSWLYVFLGAGLGGVARYAISELTRRGAGPDSLPLATLSVNVIGSLLMGVAFSALAGAERSPALFALIGAGFLGGFTTFSAFSLDVIRLLERGELSLALGYLIGSVALSIGALALGLFAHRVFAG